MFSDRLISETEVLRCKEMVVNGGKRFMDFKMMPLFCMPIHVLLLTLQRTHPPPVVRIIGPLSVAVMTWVHTWLVKSTCLEEGAGGQTWPIQRVFSYHEFGVV